MLKTVLGIGNPGEKYEATRHNIGWRVAEAIAAEMGERFRKDGFEYWSAEGRLGRSRVRVVKAWTYVNETGRVLPELRARGTEFDPDGFLVVADDIALPLGSVRIRKDGSSGGHNGLKSVEAVLGTRDYARMRLGVGGPGAAANPDYVLGRFGKDEVPVVEETVKVAVAAAAAWAAEGIDKAMNRFNRTAKDAR